MKDHWFVANFLDEILFSLAKLEVIILGKRTNRTNHLGETNVNTKGTMMKIINYRSNEDIDVEFLDDHHFVKEHQAYSNFKSGQLKNPYDKTMGGVGKDVE